jgi:uncharacterized protein (DUF433 family)
MNWKQQIVTGPEICNGRPRLRDTPLTAEFLLGLKVAGWPDSRILQHYPMLKPDHLQAVYAYAHAIISDESLLPAI